MSINIEFEVESSFDFQAEELIESTIEYCLNVVDCPYEAEINVILTNNESIQQLNKEYRDMDSPTDVLSFPFIEYPSPADFKLLEDEIVDCFNPESGELVLGDMVISVEKVISQSEDYGHSVKRELAFLVVHSMLHLFGYDHITEHDRIEMEKIQQIILDELKIYR